MATQTISLDREWKVLGAGPLHVTPRDSIQVVVSSEQPALHADGEWLHGTHEYFLSMGGLVWGRAVAGSCDVEVTR